MEKSVKQLMLCHVRDTDLTQDSVVSKTVLGGQIHLLLQISKQGRVAVHERGWKEPQL